MGLPAQLDLSGAWCFIREWGRIGQAGQTRTVPYPLPPRRKPPLSGSAVPKSDAGMLKMSLYSGAFWSAPQVLTKLTYLRRIV
jgi:hypothetical protein